MKPRGRFQSRLPRGLATEIPTDPSTRGHGPESVSRCSCCPALTRRPSDAGGSSLSPGGCILNLPLKPNGCFRWGGMETPQPQPRAGVHSGKSDPSSPVSLPGPGNAVTTDRRRRTRPRPAPVPHLPRVPPGRPGSASVERSRPEASLPFHPGRLPTARQPLHWDLRVPCSHTQRDSVAAGVVSLHHKPGLGLKSWEWRPG